MTRARGPLPARAVALSVVGRGPDDTVDALAATGTTWGGSVTLRITVTGHGGAFGSAEEATGCFRYRFTYPREPDFGHPGQVACDSVAPADLSRPSLPQGIDTATRRTVQAAVDRLGPARRADPTDVETAVRSALDSDYTLDGGRQDAGAFFWVRYGDDCLAVTVAPSAVDVGKPLTGLDCFGH